MVGEQGRKQEIVLGKDYVMSASHVALSIDVALVSFIVKGLSHMNFRDISRFVKIFWF